MRARARRSARVERVRRRAPLAGAIAASIAIVAFAGVAAARRLSQSSRVWSASAGGVADQAASSKGASLQASPRTPAGAPATLAAAAEAYERGHVRDALLALTALRVDTGTHERETADSLLALAALQASADSLGGGTLGSDVPKLVVASTSEAIARARPGSYVLAPLSLGRAAACIGGRLTCADEQLREDLAWVLLLGTPTEQDEARRLRALWIGQPDGRAVR
jgi:hypothetical protein